MAKEHGTKALTEEEKEAYDLRRDAVIDKMPRTYWLTLEKYYKKKKRKAPKRTEVYSFMCRTTYKAELLKSLEEFTASL